MNQDYYELNDTLEAEKAEILAEAYQDEVEAHPERFLERSECCNAELYDDREFCCECYTPNPSVIYIRKENMSSV